ncbi:unnamed protein product [Protopolystoma xenopodis]|uniref:Uncharacterized protein n=1 Tax=Protopolystoma xenopodis TaxID=117903 RepID=A0A448WE06_9PLAT|nr:unnamed protein product [Protopolystoma xenopodis]
MQGIVVFYDLQIDVIQRMILIHLALLIFNTIIKCDLNYTGQTPDVTAARLVLEAAITLLLPVGVNSSATKMHHFLLLSFFSCHNFSIA